jgi:hypothetical protein
MPSFANASAHDCSVSVAPTTPQCTADLEFSASFGTKMRTWTSRIDFPNREPADPKISDNEEVLHYVPLPLPPFCITIYRDTHLYCLLNVRTACVV